MRTDQYLEDDWRNHAACSGMDLDVFFNIDHGLDPTPAIEVCVECPVSRRCLEYAVERNDIHYGVVGGYTPQQRRRLRAKVINGTL